MKFTNAFLPIILSFILHGCASFEKMNNVYEVGVTANDGNPYETIRVFNKHFSTYQAYPNDKELLSVGLIQYCAALSLVYRLDDVTQCIKEYGRIAGMPDANNIHKSIYYQMIANRAEVLGDYNAVLKYARLALQADDKYTPMRPWELLATVYARQENYDEVKAYIDKIDSFKIDSLFGMFSLNETEMSRLKRASMTRVYIEMGDSKKAREILNRPLANQSMSEIVLKGVIQTMEIYSASLESVNESVVRNIYENTESNKPANNREEIDWGFYDRILQMTMSAKISLQLGAMIQSEKVYMRLLGEPKFQYQKPLYLVALSDLAEINYRKNKYKSALKYAKKAIDIVEQAKLNIYDNSERSMFLRKHEGIYDLADKINTSKK
ncbi:MAG: hypothetical protein OQK98_14470 [Gammaproteobacteria bacterium]|nr:hypothetical protein [Gammaproteobacteria bacterium]